MIIEKKDIFMKIKNMNIRNENKLNANGGSLFYWYLEKRVNVTKKGLIYFLKNEFNFLKKEN